MNHRIPEELIEFIKESPTAFHAVSAMAARLTESGFIRLEEGMHWNLKQGGSYYVTRNDSSLIAFTIPEHPFQGMRIMASHSDSPSFKIKENPEMESEGHYIRLNVERYGGMLFAPWFDRPLSVAGRVIVKDPSTDGKPSACFLSKLVNIDRDLLMIPNLAIHMDRDANNGHKYNAQKDMLPLYGDLTAKNTFFQTIAEAANVTEDEILGHDLFLYNRQEPCIWGASREFLSAPRLDDLQCAFASLKGFLSGAKEDYLALHCVFDNEEVGSGTKQGAASTFLADTLIRINHAMGRDEAGYRQSIANSFMLSADNAHGVHPNHTDKACPTNRPYPGNGVVIKYSANQKYTTDAVSAAVFEEICNRANVPYQIYVNRSDILGGSTLGNISTTQVPVNTVDIGLAQLAMHSPYETGSVKDTDYMIQAMKTFFEASVRQTEDGYELNFL